MQTTTQPYFMRKIILFLSCLFFLSCTTNTEVDLIVYNAKIYTVDSTFSNAEAFAVKNGVFIDVGTSKDILKRYKAKESIDAQGKPVYPGFYDAHAHMFIYADFLQEADLTGSKSLSEVISRMKEFQSKHPHKKWLVGRGWDQSLWEDKRFPTKDSLDKYFADIPVFLSRIDYHAAVVNSKALNIAQIDSSYAVEGGQIMMDTVGNPNGLLIDKAMDIVSKFIPTNDEKGLLAALRQAQDSLISVGLTSIAEAGLNSDQIDYLKKFYQNDSLKIRTYAMIFAEPHNVNQLIRDGIYSSEKLNIKSIKMMADGALGSRGASLLAPYSDSPLNNGLMLHTPEEFDAAIKTLAASPFQVATHAIGDSANRVILDLYGKYLGEKNSRRWRIEHAQVISPEDFKKFKKYSIIPSIQPTHATSDMNWLNERIGEDRAKGAYAYKDLLRAYGKVALGSDFPVEHFNPLYGFHAAVTRQDKDGLPKNGFQLENALTREESLKGMTIWAAYSCFEEKKRGSIEKGKDADFVILEEDIMTADAHKLRNIKTLRTVIAGESVYIRK